MAQHDSAKFTLYGWLVALWICLIAFQYGYHISVLNQIHDVLTCPDTSSAVTTYGLSSCIQMSTFQYGVVTSIFTVGGLLGSLGANIAMDKSGRNVAAKLSLASIALGSGIMGISGSVVLMAIGRMIVGIGCGIGICVAPVYLSECSPPSIVHNVGVLVQLGIVFGIMITQALGLTFATPGTWRYVLAFSFILGALQFLASTLIVESPVWLSGRGRHDAKRASSGRLWVTAKSSPSERDAEDPLLSEDRESGRSRHERRHSGSRERAHEPPVTVPKLLVSRDLRRPLFIVCLAMATQQLSGINAVLYYSNDILSRSLPGVGPYVSLGITVFNALMTFPPIFLISRLGRRKLLILSSFGMVLSSLAVGIGLDTNVGPLSSVTVITFVMSFAVGLGPVPFVMIPEVSPPHAVSALSSMGLAFSWISNGLVALVFLPLRNLLSGGDESKEGHVFYLFSGVLTLCAIVLLRLYR